MHRFDDTTADLTRSILSYALERISAARDPLGDGPATPEDLTAMAGPSVTEDGLGGRHALKVFTEVLARASISADHPRNLAFVPSAPAEAAVLFDLAVSASGIYAGSWMEGAGAVHAENEALRWLSDLAGFPPEAGGVFVSGGSAGNLSALVAARHRWLENADGRRPTRWRVAATAATHASVAAAARVMDAGVLPVAADERGRMTGEALAAALDDDPAGPDGVFAVAATAGTTNAGVVDDLAGIAEVCAERGLWLHVDGAYGAAALAAPSARPLFAGIERADSFIVDPHKWLFAPFDSCALLYRDPPVARRAHTQKAEYLDVLTSRPEWNPSEYAFHLTRRARGLPFWFSLAVHGTAAYERSIEATLALARRCARMIDACTELELVMEPELSVVLFRRRGWAPEDYEAWSARALSEGLAFVVPTAWHGETVLRFCFVNPRTSDRDVAAILRSLR